MPRTRTSKPTDVLETILDQFAGPARPMSHGEVEAITTQFKKAMVERMLGGELTHHVGYPPGGEKPPGISNQRNGTSGKTVLTDDGPLTLDGGPLGPPVSDRRRVLATRLAPRHPVLRLPAGGPPRALHDQCPGKCARAPAQDPQDPGPLPDRRGRH